jgi:ABC-type antimicrobial peptide transport system permease subunit
LALVGIVVGVPLGVILGKTVWNAFADNLGVVPVAIVPVLLVVILAASVVVVANIIAIAPALVATRSKPVDLLRSPQLNGPGRG